MRCFISGKNRLHLWQKNADDSKLPVDLHGNVIGDFSVYWSYKSTRMTGLDPSRCYTVRQDGESEKR